MPGAIETFFVSVLGGIATGVIGLVGLHLQQRFTANAEQISSTLSELEEMTEACAAVSVKAWNSPGNPNSDETVETICQLHAIGEFVDFITDRVSGSQLRLSSPLVNFRQASSGDDFDVKQRPGRPERAIAIRSAAASLRISLREVDYERRRFYLPFISH